MRWLFLFITLSLSLCAFAQTGPAKHPRVLEVEEHLRDEASRYFTRRFPGQPFFVRVEVMPMRRDSLDQGRKMESLPYFDYESEESVDEWDDPKTPLAFLRHRVTKISVELSVPEGFDDTKVASIKEEISIYLKLLPFRDDVRVERKLKESIPELQVDLIILLGGLLVSALLVGLIVRNGMMKSKTAATAANGATAAAVGTQSSSNRPRESTGKSATAVSGDVTFHDPIKTMDIVHLKLSQIEKSGTFPTLTDILALHELGERHPDKLGAIVSEMPTTWHKLLFPRGKGQSWLEAFSSPGRIDHECLMLLDRISKERTYVGGERQWEDLLIQLWRLGDKSVAFFKKIPQDHAFIVLSALPKSISLAVAKKAFPGAWGRLLENSSNPVIVAPQVITEYHQQTLEIEPLLQWRILENYRKDRELLKYLDRVAIEDEKDIYQTLPEDSFVWAVRPGFFAVFEQEGDDWKNFVLSFPLEKWALAVMNSSRNYIRQVVEALDEKQRVVFSQYLKSYDQLHSLEEQIQTRHAMAQAYQTKLAARAVAVKNSEQEPEAGDHAQSA